MIVEIALSSLLTIQTATPLTIRGVVVDEQGAGIPQARVEIVCGRDRRHVLSDGSGAFTVSQLPVAKCTVTAEASQFESGSALVDLTTATPSSPTLVLRIRGLQTEVIVTAARGVEESTFHVPHAASVVTRDQIAARPYQLLPQVLREEPGILLQQTTSAHTSPIIRGFTGQSNVYLIDGVRFNTSAWRPGPSQYLGWIDGAIVDRLEIVRGPGSVQYGSDALGGTINVLGARPGFVSTGLRLGGSAEATIASADHGRSGTADVTIQGSRAALRVGGGARRVEDLRAGQGLDSHSAATRFLGLPSSVFGARLSNTGFNQSGGFATGQVRLAAQSTLRALFLHESLTDSSRYDRIHGGDGLYKSGFSPQTLDFGLIRYEQDRVAGLDTVSATLSMNRQTDGRFEQTRPTTVLDRQENVNTAYGYQLEGRRHLGSRQVVSLGAEVYDEGMTAFRRQEHPVTGVVTVQRPDIPDGTSYTTTGVFVQDLVELVPNRLNLRAGLRYGRFSFRTRADAALGVPAERVTADALTFNVGAVVGLTRHVNAMVAVSRGFRAPNAADLGGVGLTGGGGFEIAPSRAAALGGLMGTTLGTDAVSSGRAVPALGPELVYSYEVGLKVHSGRFDGALTVYDTEYLDSIQRRAIVFPGNVVGESIAGYTIARQDAAGLAYIAQDARPLATRVNLDHARILGVEAEGRVRLSPTWTASAHASMTNGRLLSTREFLRRMPPPMGGATLRWSPLNGRMWAEAVISFARSQTRLNSGDVTDARIGANRTRATIASYFSGTATDLGLVKGGVLVETGETLAQVQTRLLGTAASGPLFPSAPGFVAYGARVGCHVSSQVDLIVIGENLTDRNYRLYGSGLDAPGRNVQAKLRLRF